MGQFKTKADKAFEDKLKHFLAPKSWSSAFGEVLVPYRALDSEDFEEVEYLFLQYGYYLELIDVEINMTSHEAMKRLYP